MTERTHSMPAGHMTEQAAIDLTPRMQDVLNGLLDGKSNKEIAYNLGISGSSVKDHILALKERLGTPRQSRLQVVVAYYKAEIERLKVLAL